MTCWLQWGLSHREDLAPAGVRTQWAVGPCPPTALPSLFWDRTCVWTPACSCLTPAGHGAPGVQVSPEENQNKCLCPLWLPPRISAGAVRAACWGLRPTSALRSVFWHLYGLIQGRNSPVPRGVTSAVMTRGNMCAHVCACTSMCATCVH